MADLTAIILTKNESENIRRCIEAVQPLAKRIVVVDSGSTDDTISIAGALGAEILEHPFENYAVQFNWALDHAQIQTRWVYRLDADEVVPPELAEEIERECAKHASDDTGAFLMKYKLYFLGRFLRHGGTYPFVKITVFRPDCARFEERSMGEHVVVRSGEIRQFQNDCLHYDCKNLTAFIEKHNSYATREMADHLKTMERRSSEQLYKKAEHTKRLRDGVYYRLPLFVRAKLYFWFRYYLQLGFLDGTPGKIYAFIQAYAYRFFVDAKLYEWRVEHREPRA